MSTDKAFHPPSDTAGVDRRSVWARWPYAPGRGRSTRQSRRRCVRSCPAATAARHAPQPPLDLGAVMERPRRTAGGGQPASGACRSAQALGAHEDCPFATRENVELRSDGDPGFCQRAAVIFSRMSRCATRPSCAGSNRSPQAGSARSDPDGPGPRHRTDSAETCRHPDRHPGPDRHPVGVVAEIVAARIATEISDHVTASIVCGAKGPPPPGCDIDVICTVIEQDGVCLAFLKVIHVPSSRVIFTCDSRFTGNGLVACGLRGTDPLRLRGGRNPRSNACR